MTEFDIEIVQRKLKTTVIIWFSFFVSILLYAGLVEWIRRGEMEIAVKQNRELHLIFLAAAAFCFITAAITKYIMLRIPAQKPAWSTEILVGRLLQVSLVSLALSEAICLIGLTEYFILRSYDSFYVFFIVAMLGIIMHMPRYPKWKSYLEQMTGTTLPEELQ